MANLSLALVFLVLLLSAGVGGFLARKIKLPLILGYILAGVTVGSLVVSAVSGQELVASLAEIGVAFLLFSLGIEFSFARLAKVKEVAVWGGVIQILGVIFLGTLIFPRLGFDFYSSLFLSSCFALSSTAIVAKILAERGELDSLPGEIMIGWLLVQDLAVLPLLLILPQVAVLDSIAWWKIILTVFKAAGLLILVLFLGRMAVPKLLDRIAAVHSREIFLLSVVTLCLAAAFGTAAIGLSFALGAFLAGLIVAESSQNHAVFSEIRPLRDIFAIIFFVSLGMMLSPGFLLAHFGSIFLISLIIIGIKLILVTFLVLYLGYHTKTAFFVGIGLVQVGEFSFILARVGILGNLISSELYSLILSVALFTIVLTPFFFSLAPRLYARTKKTSQLRFPRVYTHIFTRFDHRQVIEEIPLENHVVVCGFGRVGSWLGRALELAEIPFVVVDYNFQVVSDLKKRGVPVVYGDPADIDVLTVARIKQAKIVVVALPDSHTQEMVIANAQTLNPKINILCRTHQDEDLPRLRALGVKTIIQPEFEASLSFVHRILQLFDLSKEEVAGKIKRIKIEHGMG